MRAAFLAISLAVAACGGGGPSPEPLPPMPPLTAPPTATPAPQPTRTASGVAVAPTPIDPTTIAKYNDAPVLPTPTPGGRSSLSLVRSPDSGHGVQGYNVAFNGVSGIFSAVTIYVDQDVASPGGDGYNSYLQGSMKGQGCGEMSPQTNRFSNGSFVNGLWMYNACDGVEYGNALVPQVLLSFNADFAGKYVNDGRIYMESFYVPDRGTWSLLYNFSTGEYDLIYRYPDSKHSTQQLTLGWSGAEYRWNNAPCTVAKLPLVVSNLQILSNGSGWHPLTTQDALTVNQGACSDQLTLTVPPGADRSSYTITAKETP